MTLPGYLLESVRVGQANSPYTQTPDTVCADQAAFDAAYPTDESRPRTDYLILVTSEGGGRLVSARFGWTRNENIDRFTYSGLAGSFKLLPGAGVTVAGMLSPDANTTRLKVRVPTAIAQADAPYRLAVGAGTGATFGVSFVTDETSFGSPARNSAEVSLESGALNWNALDLAAFSGQPVLWQQQQFFDPKDSTGRVGLAPRSVGERRLMLNPIPATKQIPQLRLGYGLYLKAVEVASEAAFSTPAAGSVEWARDTGALNFNHDDVLLQEPVYYEGVLLGELSLPQRSLGPLKSVASLGSAPPAGAEVIFFLAGGYQFPKVELRAAASFTAGTKGTVQVDPTTGALRFSDSDVRKYGTETVSVAYGDLPVERGLVLRLFRTPVNLDGSRSDAKDVAEIYSVTGALWADPIIASPQVLLPSTPIDASAYPMSVSIVQGRGSFTSASFPRLDVASPPAGLGYYIDFDAGAFCFAERRKDVVVPVPADASAVQLPDTLVLDQNAELYLGTQKLVLGDDATLDPASGIVTFTRTTSTVSSSTSGSINGALFKDPTVDFVAAGVLPGQLLEVTATPAKGIYTIASVDSLALTLDVPAPSAEPSLPYVIRQSREVLADRYFAEVRLADRSMQVQRVRSLGIASAAALNVPKMYVDKSGFFLDGVAAAISVVDADTQADPPPGTVLLSRQTGNIRVSPGDYGKEVFWVRDLVSGTDFLFAAQLGFVQLSERLLKGERVVATYASGGVQYRESASFIVRKEVVQPHSDPTSVLRFNPDGVPVSASPAPAVFRGGRPQTLGVQCVVDTAASTITFQPDNQLTDALPHGAVVQPNERVYVDYYVTEAIGGEKTFTVQHLPIDTVAYEISDSEEKDAQGRGLNTFFTVTGNWAAAFPLGCLLRVEREQVCLLAAATYDATSDSTTITLAPGHAFQNSYRNPRLYVSSGPTPVTSSFALPAYFTPELQRFEPIARGANTFYLAGDRTLGYRPGTVVLCSSAEGQEFLQVVAVAYDGEAARTQVILSGNASRQYTSGIAPSVRPILEAGPVECTTARTPLLTAPYEVFRRVAGQPGQVLSAAEYTIDEAGRVTFAEGLRLNEEFSIFYSGRTAVQSGLALRASYTHLITPTADNGLLGQTLSVDYSLRSPDTFYFRVETMTNFRGEYASEIGSSAGSATSGPRTSNMSQLKLYEQGSKSLYFDERHIANQDVVARATMLLYHTTVEQLEGCLRKLDGRVVGNNDGSLLFDGGSGSQHPPGAVTNQVDDMVKVSAAPYKVTGPPFVVTSIGTFRKYYLPGVLSRFYPTRRNLFGVATVPTGVAAGDEVFDTGATKVTSISNLHTRLAWATVMEDADATALTLRVDNSMGSADYVRPAFRAGMKCVIQDRNGSFLYDASNPVVVSSAPTSKDLLAVTGLHSVVTAGCTISRSPWDDSAQTGTDVLTYYVFGRDYALDGESGQLKFVPNRDPPATATPTNVPLVDQQALSGEVNCVNVLTEPYKFPALYGGTSDDDGDLSLPVQGPDFDSEAMYLTHEQQLLAQVLGVTGTVGATSTVSRLDDAAAAFSNALVGMTVQLGLYTRQITAVSSATSLTFYPALIAVPRGTYHITRPTAATLLVTCLQGQVDLYGRLSVQLGAAGQGFGLLPSSVATIAAIAAGLAACRTDAQTFLGLAQQHVAGTRVLQTSDVAARNAEIAARLAGNAADVASLEDILANTDQLYDLRWLWLAARIDLRNGLLVQQANAVTNRVKAVSDSLNQLIRLSSIKK